MKTNYFIKQATSYYYRQCSNRGESPLQITRSKVENDSMSANRNIVTLFSENQSIFRISLSKAIIQPSQKANVQPPAKMPAKANVQPPAKMPVKAVIPPKPQPQANKIEWVGFSKNEKDLIKNL